MNGVRMFKLSLPLLAVAAALAFVAARPERADAHPLGNFTINRFARVEPGARDVRIVYALDMAEIPTFQEMDAIDRDGNKAVNDAERDAYLERKLPELAKNLKLTVNGTLLALRPDGPGELTLSEGQGGLQVLRIDARFVADLPEHLRGGLLDTQFRDTNYDNRLGWKEIVVTSTDGAAVRESSARAQGVSDALRSYPEDALQTPLEDREARFRFEPGVAGAATGGDTAARVAERTRKVSSPGLLDRFAESAATKELTLPVALGLLAAAVFWGALHALGPGHGKTVVAAYLVGSRGTAKHAVFLGLTVTATHTAGVYLLGFITLTASHFIVPERLYPVLSLASGVVVVAMGVSLLWGRVRALRRRGRGPGAGGRGGDGAREHTHETEVVAAPEPVLVGAGARSRLAAASVGGGAVALAPVRGVAYAEPHEHRHGAGHGHAHGHGHSHRDGGEHADGDPTWHDHGDGRGHSHAMPGADGRPVTWKSLLMLGIYGGLIPCPTAIVVLLTSISLNRIGFGLLLVVAFSAGLAAVLTGIGLLLVYAGRALSRVKVNSSLARAVPVGSAALVIVAGLLITLRAIGQDGLPLV
jgi:nickel/cobalt transporter (NicO) family protein